MARTRRTTGSTYKPAPPRGKKMRSVRKPTPPYTPAPPRGKKMRSGRTYTSTYNPPPPRLKKKSGRTRTGSTVKPRTRTPTNTGGAAPPSIGNRGKPTGRVTKAGGATPPSIGNGGKQIRKKPGGYVTITPVPSFTDQELKIRQHPPGTAQPPKPTGTKRPQRGGGKGPPVRSRRENPQTPLRGGRKERELLPDVEDPPKQKQSQRLKELDAKLRKLREKLRRAEAMERGPTA